MKYLRWIYRFVRRQRGAMTAMMACHVLLAACAVGFVYVSKKLVDVAVAMVQGSHDDDLWLWGLSMVGIVILRIGLNALRSYLQVRTEISLKNSLRRRLFDILLRMQNDGGSRRHTGDVLSRMQEDVRMVSNVCASSLPNLFGTLLQLAAALTFLMILEPRLALIVIVVAPLGVLAGKYVSGRIRRLTHDIRESDARVQSHLQESVQHITLLQSMEYADASASSLGELQGGLYGNELRGARTYGMMTAFLQLVAQIQRPLVEMSSQVPSLIHATASIDRIMELEALPREEDVEPDMLSGTAGVRFEGVFFSYPGSSRNVLENFTHDFRPGSRTAIVGPTGVGKSTMIRLLLSLLRPQSGSIIVYTSSHSAAASPATRCNLVYVPQGNSLFSGTVRDNLLMGNPDATEEQLYAALHTAAADFVLQLPGGLDAQCFEAGAGLSEGQAQRIAIARGLLRPGSILLLDEFSSALDADTELTMMQRLTAAHPDHTMIFITHRDKIIDYCTDVLRLG